MSSHPFIYFNLYISASNGRFYCGARVLSCVCCDGRCGPTTGCNCPPCQPIPLYISIFIFQQAMVDSTVGLGFSLVYAVMGDVGQLQAVTVPHARPWTVKRKRGSRIS
ncbi:unnamed protein product [Owenia fusiformis]|uniref:Uncharacterized protein n=1 Tax=Owenia fusiformis TaxID=6347 RepID=A0A8J1TEQ9_OWEFU|nr:unnamed protein product [Owenia fusiformis]